MSIDLKDAVWFIVYIVSMVSIFLAFRNEVKNLKNEVKKEKSIIWQEGGRLNLVDHKACREYRDGIWQSMRKCDNVMEGMNTRLDSINEKIIRVLVKLELNGKDDKNNV